MQLSNDASVLSSPAEISLEAVAYLTSRAAVVQIRDVFQKLDNKLGLTTLRTCLAGLVEVSEHSTLRARGEGDSKEWIDTKSTVLA